jgi:hypothetical protein
MLRPMQQCTYMQANLRLQMPELPAAVQWLALAALCVSYVSSHSLDSNPQLE